MRAAVCRSFGEPLTIEELNLDPPGVGEVRVDIEACAICASDLHAMDGSWGGDLPAVFGHEASGVVGAVGEGVSLVSRGDHVVVTLIRSCGRCFFCEDGHGQLCEHDFALASEHRIHASDADVQQGIYTGAFAEAVVVDQSQVVAIPPDLPFDAAALLACGVVTGYGAVVNTASVAAGQSVVVIGTGGVGLNSVQGAATAGAQPVIAVDVANQKLDVARPFGATHGVRADASDAREQILALTNGRGADHVVVTVGSTAAIEQGLTFLRRAGTLTVVGMTEVGAHAQIETSGFAGNSQRILGSFMGSTRPRVDIPKLVALHEQGRYLLTELITGRFPLEDINEAIDQVRQGNAIRNVIVMR